MYCTCNTDAMRAYPWGFRLTISIRVIFLLWRCPPLTHLVPCTTELTNCFSFGVITQPCTTFLHFFAKKEKCIFIVTSWYLDCVFGTVQLKNIWIITFWGQEQYLHLYVYSNTVQCFASRNVIYKYTAHTIHLEYLYLLFRKQMLLENKWWQNKFYF